MTRLNDAVCTPKLFKCRLIRHVPKTPRTGAQGIVTTDVNAFKATLTRAKTLGTLTPTYDPKTTANTLL